MRKICIEDLEYTSLEQRKRLLTPNQPEGSTPFRAGLCKNQRAIREIERRESDLARYLRPDGHPTKSARNHEMNDEKEIVLELQDNTLSHSPHTENALPIGRADGWIDGTEKKR